MKSRSSAVLNFSLPKSKRREISGRNLENAPEIMNLLKELWATGCTKKVTEGVLAAEFIWGEDLNKIPGLAAAVKADLDSIQEKGMLETVKGIL